MRRCRCRPGCLTWLRKTDVTVPTPAGDVLAEHVQGRPAYPVDGLTSVQSALSKVNR